MRLPPPDRRRLLTLLGGAAGSVALAGCDRLPHTNAGRAALQAGEDASLFAQRLLLSPARLAPEYASTDISPWFKPNGTSDPPDRDYKALTRRKFADFRLEIGGLVERPEKIALPDLRRLPARTQITRHDCVEGWSCIGEWTGVPLSVLLQGVGLKPKARYVVLHCFDTMEGGDEGGGDTGDDDAEAPSSKPVRYYESIDLEDAYHPQTILAYGMNGQDLPVANGAPLRLRLERQLGYKMAKYVRSIELVSDLGGIGEGRGGYWEDRGYDWYAGI